jgi:TetR/AcrR family tetracycline transcriptional repressor
MVMAALELMDETGLEGLTMRRLADSLGVKSASLYWHVRDKEELLNLMADAICSEIRSPEATDDWRQRLEALAREYRRVLKTHRDAALLLATTLPVGPYRLRLAETSLATLLDAGFTAEVTAQASLLFVDYVTNFVVEEDRAEAIAAAFQTDSDDAGSVSDWFAALPADQYPSLVALAPQLTNPNAEARFEFGMTTLLNGLPTR